MTRLLAAAAARAISVALGETGAPWIDGPCSPESCEHDTCVAVRALDTAGLLEQQVYLVQRDNLDGLYLFADEEDRDAYAALYPAAETGTAYVMTRDQAALRIAEHCGEHGESREDCGCEEE